MMCLDYSFQTVYTNSTLQKSQQDIWKFIQHERDIITTGEEDSDTATEQETARATDHETISTIIAPGEYLAGTSFLARMHSQLFNYRAYVELLDHYDGPLPSINLSSQDVTRWKMAWRAIQAFNFAIAFGTFGSGFNTIKSRCKDWPDIGDIFDDRSVALGFSIAAFIYGGLHALAWFAHVDSSTEQLLWRVSACVVMGGVPIMYGLGKADGNTHKVFRNFRFGYWLSIMITVSSWIALLAYPLARAYLVVECFINLSHLLAGVYDVPSWAAYFPHIS